MRNFRKLIPLLCTVTLLAFSGSTLTQETPQGVLKRAGQAFQEGNYDSAIQLYLSIVEIDKDNLEARVRLATSYFFAANHNPDYYPEAVKQYRTVISLRPKFPLSYLHLGEIAYIWGKEYQIEGKEKHARGLFESALNWIETSIELRETDSDEQNLHEAAREQIHLALIHYRLGNHQKAFQMIDKAISDYKTVSTSKEAKEELFIYFLNSGQQYWQSKLFDQALIYLEGAWFIESRPEVKSLFQTVVREIGTKDKLPPINRKKQMREEGKEEEIPLLQGQIKELQKNILSLQERIDWMEKKILELEEKLEEVSQKAP